MAPQSLFDTFLRYTIGGVVFGGFIAASVTVSTTIPRGLLAMCLMAPAVLVAPFLFNVDTGLDTIDEGAEAGFIIDDPGQYRMAELSFPGRHQLAFAMIGLFVVGVALFVVPA